MKEQCKNLCNFTKTY